MNSTHKGTIDSYVTEIWQLRESLVKRKKERDVLRLSLIHIHQERARLGYTAESARSMYQIAEDAITRKVEDHESHI